MTMRRQTAPLVRQYAKIEPAERFRLVVRALARDDRAEFEHLCQTCPTKMYRASDAEYSGRFDAAKFVTLLFSVDMARALGKLEMADAVAKFAPVIMVTIREALLRDIRALWGAFAAFSRKELGLEPEATLSAWARPMLELVQGALDGTEPGEPDPRTDHWAEDLAEIWSGAVQRR